MIRRVYEFRLRDTIPPGKDSTYTIPEQHSVITTGEGDTSVRYIHVSFIDTLFSLSSQHILKKFKGAYFLNIPYGELDWEVQQLRVDGDSLSISSISEKSVDKLPPPADTGRLHFDPSKREFKKFVKRNGFGEGETFVRKKIRSGFRGS